MSNETPINGQGIRLVKQSEGINVPLLQPWEIEGEKELIKGTTLAKNIELLEDKLSSMYQHIQTCTEDSCGVSVVFDEIMDCRRKHCIVLLKDDKKVLYEILNGLLIIYLMSKGDENLFLVSTMTGLAISAEMIIKTRK